MKKKTQNMTEGPILKCLLLFTLPLIMSGMLQQFYSTADQIIAGRFAGEIALAAVGASGYISAFVLNLFMGTSLGCTVVCAKFFGAKDGERISKTVHTSIGFALVSGVAIAFFGFFASRWMLGLVDTPADVIDHATTYMKIIFLGTPFSLVYNFAAGILRAGGDAKRPLYILMVSGFVNVVLNFITVYFFKLAEVGVALSTVVSQIISFAVAINILMKRDDDFKLEIRKIRFHKDEFLNVIRVGLPTGINGAIFSFANILLQSTVNTFGATFMAASSVASNVNNYISHVQSAFGSAMVSFVGQNYGAKKTDRISKSVVLGLAITGAATACISIMLVSFPHFFLGLFSDESAVIEAGVGKLIIMAIGIIFNVPQNIFSAVYKGTEHSTFPMVVNLAATFLVRIVWISVFFPMNPVFEMIFYCYPISWGLSSLIEGIGLVSIMKKLHTENRTAVEG